MMGAGLYYYRMRYYHPGLGVFVSRDVLGYAEGSNLYRYCDCTALLAFSIRRASLREGLISVLPLAHSIIELSIAAGAFFFGRKFARIRIGGSQP